MTARAVAPSNALLYNTAMDRIDKQAAAKLLGRSVRVLQRYTAQGRLSVKYEKGKTGYLATYDKSEVLQLKKELNEPQSLFRPAALQTNQQAMSSMTTEAVQTLIEAMKQSALLPAKLLLTIPEAAVILGIAPDLLRETAAQARVEIFNVAGADRIDRRDLDAIIDQLRKQARKPQPPTPQLKAKAKPKTKPAAAKRNKQVKPRKPLK